MRIVIIGNSLSCEAMPGDMRMKVRMACGS